MLLENGADPGNCNAGLETALHTFFNDAVHQMLLYHGETIENEARDSRGMTPLHFVTWSSKSTVDMVRRLVERGNLTDTMLKDNEGRSVLHFAAQRGNTAVVEYLIGLGPHVDVRCRDRRRRTVLHYAVENKRTEIIAKIIRQGADIHARDFQGRTVLHHAAWRGNLEATKCLLELGAVEDLPSQDVGGRTPLDVAAEQRAEPVANFLKDFAASHGISGIHGEHYRTTDKNTPPTVTARPYPVGLASWKSHKFITMAAKLRMSGVVILLLLYYYIFT
jgi:ankyrin repeat protein